MTIETSNRAKACLDELIPVLQGLQYRSTREQALIILDRYLRYEDVKLSAEDEAALDRARPAFFAKLKQQYDEYRIAGEAFDHWLKTEGYRVCTTEIIEFVEKAFRAGRASV